MLFYFIGDTSKHKTNVISFGYYVHKEAKKLSFTVAYSRKDDLYDKKLAKSLLTDRYDKGEFWTIDYDSESNTIDQLVHGLRLVQKKEWFHIDAKFFKHPLWAYKLYYDNNEWKLSKNGKVTKFLYKYKVHNESY